jgi:hypothetical protein
MGDDLCAVTRACGRGRGSMVLRPVPCTITCMEGPEVVHRTAILDAVPPEQETLTTWKSERERERERERRTRSTHISNKCSEGENEILLKTAYEMKGEEEKFKRREEQDDGSQDKEGMEVKIKKGRKSRDSQGQEGPSHHIEDLVEVTDHGGVDARGRGLPQGGHDTPRHHAVIVVHKQRGRAILRPWQQRLAGTHEDTQEKRNHENNFR